MLDPARQLVTELTPVRLRHRRVRLDLDGRRVLRETRYALDERVRDVRQSPDGWLLLATDDPADGRILRVEKLG